MYNQMNQPITISWNNNNSGNRNYNNNSDMCINGVPGSGEGMNVHTTSTTTSGGMVARYKNKLNNTHNNNNGPLVPHRGKLGRLPSSNNNASYSYLYCMEIEIDPKNKTEIRFDRFQYERISQLFSIIDTESKGLISKKQVRDFVALRCPVFRRRDEAVRRFEEKTMGGSSRVGKKEKCKGGFGGGANGISPLTNLISSTEKHLRANIMRRIEGATGNTCPQLSPPRDPTPNSTFDEVWEAVITCGFPYPPPSNAEILLGLEAFAVFCRFIALAQYQEAKQRFSERHLQQTRKELVMVEVPPPSAPAALTVLALKGYEEKSCGVAAEFRSSPLPELDLNHCLVASHDDYRDVKPGNDKRATVPSSPGRVIVSVFGNRDDGSRRRSTASASSSASSSSSSTDQVEFTVTFSSGDGDSPTSMVRRTLSDMEWLHNTFVSHQRLGGTLCGRILPPFPSYRPASESSVVFIPSFVKSFWGSIVSTTTSDSTSKKEKDRKMHLKHARVLERCLNYLLEHPALSTSFALNAILKASQLGLEAAKRILQEETNSSNRIYPTAPAPAMEDPCSPTTKPKLNSTSSTNSPPSPSLDNSNPSQLLHNLSWIRTAAQAAMALKLHGILDATGCASASAWLQHASLPSFDTSRSKWRGDGQCSHSPPPSLESSRLSVDGKDDDDAEVIDTEANICFEDGVVAVESELHDDDADYDLLPSPTDKLPTSPKVHVKKQDDPKKFYYGPNQHIFGDESSVNGCVSVDVDIDKLREVIGAMDTILNRCFVASSNISDARREQSSLHHSILSGLDAWIALRGFELISERALFQGIAALEGSHDVLEKSDLSLTDDLSWQASLASSAVSAAEDVRSAVKAARTSSRAKDAAVKSAASAQKSYDNATDNDASPEDIRVTRTRASITHSNAIYAAVIEHEAFSAKRRAALALAHDVKCWNRHRQREMMQMCLDAARTQRDAAAKAKNAWSNLYDGLFGPTATNLSAYDEPYRKAHVQQQQQHSNPPLDQEVAFMSCPKIIPVDHVALTPRPKLVNDTPTNDFAMPAPSVNIPAPIAQHFEEDNISSDTYTKSHAPPTTDNAVDCTNASDTSGPKTKLDDNTSSPLEKVTTPSSTPSSPRQEDLQQSGHSNATNINDVMTASMQSLVDGLMTWGLSHGTYDPRDDMSLPSGMAVNIALEESAAMQDNNNSEETSGVAEPGAVATIY